MEKLAFILAVNMNKTDEKDKQIICLSITKNIDCYR